jgi:hypothetical protein
MAEEKGMGKVTMQLRKYWHCKGCTAEAVTFDDSIPMHYCGSSGLPIPLTGIDLPAKITVVEREDYIGNEIQRKSSDGKPVQCVLIETEDGVDAYAYAPVATAAGQGNTK